MTNTIERHILKKTWQHHSFLYKSIFKLILIYKTVLRHLLVALSKVWNSTADEAELNVMWEKAKISRRLSIICIILGEGTAIAYTMRMIYVIYTVHLNPQTSKDGTFFRPMYMFGKFPYDTQSSPSYEITWGLQIFSTFVSAGSFSAIDSLFITLVLCLCGQLINLQAAFRKIGGNEELKGPEFMRTLSELVKKHRKLNK